MEGDAQGAFSLGPVLSRYRSPAFSEAEVKGLLNIIDKYKTIILNKSSSAAASHAKEVTWSKIAKIFNTQGFTHTRSADCLKIKWINLKKRAKKVTNNLIDARNTEFDDAIKQRVMMMCIAEHNTGIVAGPTDSDTELNSIKEIKPTNASQWNGNEDEDVHESIDGDRENKSRHRSPTFSHREVKVLLNIINKHKRIICNKSISSAANHAKDATWLKIAKIFNNQGFIHTRSEDSLKSKWSNLKNDVRRMSNNNSTDARNSEFDKVRRMMVMMRETDSNISTVEEPMESDSEYNFTVDIEDNEQTNDSHWNGNEESDGSIDGDNENEGSMKRSMNFSPEECSLLLQCVKQEKNIVFSKETTTRAINLKNGAWNRISDSYNKLSPQKRSTKVLRTKFTNMKKRTSEIKFRGFLKDFGKKHNKLEDSDKKIKAEPLFSCSGDPEPEIDDDFDDHNEIDQSSDHRSHSNQEQDPLSTVLSTDSGISSINLSENKEVVKLKLELLNYKLETAKIKRKRIQELAQYEAAEREMRATENSLRLRAARLEVIAAEMKLPLTATHPALAYTTEEVRAQHYIQQYHAS